MSLPEKITIPYLYILLSYERRWSLTDEMSLLIYLPFLLYRLGNETASYFTVKMCAVINFQLKKNIYILYLTKPLSKRNKNIHIRKWRPLVK